MSAKNVNLSFLPITGNYTMAATAQYQYVQATLAAPATLTLPDIALTLSGQPLYINNSASGNALTVSPTNATIAGAGSLTVASNTSAFLVSDPSGGQWRVQNLLGSTIGSIGTSVDTAVVRWNGTTGSALQSSGVLIDVFNNVTVPGNLLLNTVGKGIQVKEGVTPTIAKQGTAVLAGGTATVSNSGITAVSRIFLTVDTVGGTPGWLRVSAKNVGTSFVITSSSGTDTSTVAWFISEGL